MRGHRGSLLRILPVATLLLISGSSCRTSVSYNPRALASSAEAIAVIRQILEAQHGQYAPIEVEVSETKFSILRSKSNPILGTGGLNRTVIRYSTIAEISLSKKNRWFAVTFFGVNQVALLHVYTPDVQSAKRFMDAIETLKGLASRG